MLAYAAHRRQRRRLSPATLSLIIGGHAVALALLITARMEVTGPPEIVKTWIRNIPLPQDPPPPPPEPLAQTPSPAPQSHMTQTPAVIDLPRPGPAVDLGPPTPMVPDIGPAIDRPLQPPVDIDSPKAPVKIAARLSTPSDLLRPPYPETKRRLEEEATLHLRLSVDERGRVTAVEPVGTADPEFLSSARKHLIRNWRYRPATEDGRAVPSTLTITLRFRLEDV